MGNTKLLFGALIAIILLGLYAYSLIEAIQLALSDQPGAFSPGLSHTLATVGGLVSALVIAELAITKPGDKPGVRELVAADPAAPAPSARAKRTAGLIGVIYVLVWIALGLAAYVVGAMLHPEKVQALTDFGQSWLGLAVAAGYSYFGISPES